MLRALSLLLLLTFLPTTLWAGFSTRYQPTGMVGVDATTNALSISTIGDHMGWMIGAVKSLSPPVNVEPTTWSRIRQLAW